MNFLGHHEVARRAFGDENPSFMLGTMVSDFVGMLRLRRTYRMSPDVDLDVVAGIELHKRTNTIFDELQEIKSLERSLIVDFKTFLPRWTAVQCGRVGKDILFDGLYCRDVATVESYRRTMAAAASGRVALNHVSEPVADFAQGLATLQQKLDVTTYADPAIVAVRLRQRLQGTRNQFDAAALLQLTEAMAEHQPIVYAIGGRVMDTVVSSVA